MFLRLGDIKQPLTRQAPLRRWHLSCIFTVVITAHERLALGRCFALLVALLFALAPFSASAGSDWQVVKVGTRDYLTLDNIAKFYGLPTNVQPSGPEGKTLNLDNGRIQLQVTLENREAIINGVRNWLSFPIIAKDGHFLMSRVDLAKTVEPQLRPQMIPNLGKVTTVVLDPGHGAFDKGACGAYGCEKDFVLDVARQLKPLLEAKGLKVVMTRDSDVFIPLDVRARIANSTRDSIFVSLHMNATDSNPNAAGFEIYSLTPRGAPSTQDDGLALRFFNMQIGSPVDAPSLALSMSIYHSVLGHLPEFDRGIKRARFAVLRLTKIPAVLIEGGFVTERAEAKLIANSAWRAKYAQSISIGIENYKNLVEKRQRPMMLADYQRQLGGELIARDPLQPSPESANTVPAMMNASNAQTPAAGAPPGPAQTSSVGPANAEQEQDEPETASTKVGAPTPAASASETKQSQAATAHANGAPAAAPPALANSASQTSGTELTEPPAHMAPAPPAPPLEMPSLGQRLLRWMPVVPPWRP